MDRLDELLKSLLDNSKERISVIKKRGDRGSLQEKEPPCLSEEIFACYLDNLLNDTEKEDVEEHLIRCGDCLQQVVFLHRLKKEIKEEGYMETPQEVIKRVKDLIPERPSKDLVEIIFGFARDTIRVIKDTDAMFSPLEAVPVEARQGETEKTKDLVHLSKVFDSLKAEIIIDRLNNKTCEMEVITTDPSTETPLDDIRLNLLSGERELASYLTVSGRASFKNLCLGNYTLVIIMKKDIIGKIRLQLETV